MSNIKIISPFHTQQNHSPSNGRRLRKTRESQPNLFLQDHHFGEKTKKQQENKPTLLKKAPRMSEMPILESSYEKSPSPKKQTETLKQKFGSPAHHKPSKMLVKSASTYLFSPESESAKVCPKQPMPNPVCKEKKSPIEEHKKTLYKIEQMLLNYGINQNMPKQKKENEKNGGKTPRSPRFSQYLPLQNQFIVNAKRKQNQSYGNDRKANDQPQEEIKVLKQSVSTHSSMKNMKKLKITDFQLGKQLGRGRFGAVKLVRHKKTGMVFSLKTIKKSVVKKQQIAEQLIKQIKIQSFLNQFNIIKLYSVFDDTQNIYLLLELCYDGNLYQYMLKKGKIQQKQAKDILNSICEGIAELHQNYVIHRDLKPENIVLHNGMAKICDFGWSTIIKDQLRETFCGTPLYVSPELLKGHLYNEKIDLWSVGVLGYEMMVGKIPFDIKSQKDLTKIVTSKIIYPKTLSKNAISFLQNLLQKDPSKRKNIMEVLNHPFLQNKKE